LFPTSKGIEKLKKLLEEGKIPVPPETTSCDTTPQSVVCTPSLGHE
jgi:hypothetical protein